MQMYGRRITPAETFARIDAIDLNRVKEVAYKYLVNKPMAVSAYGPVETLPPIEWFREHDRVSFVCLKDPNMKTTGYIERENPFLSTVSLADMFSLGGRSFLHLKTVHLRVFGTSPSVETLIHDLVNRQNAKKPNSVYHIYSTRVENANYFSYLVVCEQ